jgi:hypothetical protein
MAAHALRTPLQVRGAIWRLRERVVHWGLRRALPDLNDFIKWRLGDASAPRSGESKEEDTPADSW